MRRRRLWQNRGCLRAAFKCIAEGKQCAMLVPTTILAFQHYQTILKRFEGFPVEVDMISRFRTPQEQAKILRGLRQGSMDMVVGTHRLISKDIKFKDLGLVIIDEEQRFGVAQKEHLKELFPTVDVLTLSRYPDSPHAQYGNDRHPRYVDAGRGSTGSTTPCKPM